MKVENRVVYADEQTPMLALCVVIQLSKPNTTEIRKYSKTSLMAVSRLPRRASKKRCDSVRDSELIYLNPKKMLLIKRLPFLPMPREGFHLYYKSGLKCLKIDLKWTGNKSNLNPVGIFFSFSSPSSQMTGRPCFSIDRGGY